MNRPFDGHPRVGIVGWGEIARVHARCLRATGAHLVGVVSRRGEAPAGARSFATLAAMLPHVDAITVATPNHLHAGQCLEAVEAGRAVMVEKPMAIDAAQLDEMERRLPAAAVPVRVGFRLRHNPELRALRRRVDGRLRRVSCRFELGIDELAADRDWTRSRRRTGGVLFTLGVHVHDLARWLARAGADRLERLEAEVHGSSPAADYPLAGRVAAVTRDGVELATVVDTRPGLGYAIRVEATTAEANTADADETLRVETRAADEAREYRGLIQTFVGAVRDSRVDPAAVHADLRVHRDLLEAREFADTGGPGAQCASPSPGRSSGTPSG